MTTAQLREKARQAEKQLQWIAAADFYSRAIEVYPNNGGELAKRDIANLESKKAACLYMAEAA